QGMGGDPKSPLYLGNGNIDIPALFVSVLQLCFAGIVAVVFNSMIRKAPKAGRRKSRGGTSIAPTALPPRPIVAPPQQATSAQPPAASQAPAPVAAPPIASRPATQAVAPPKPAVAPAPPPKDPGKPKKIVYNLVGDPIPDDED